MASGILPVDGIVYKDHGENKKIDRRASVRNLSKRITALESFWTEIFYSRNAETPFSKHAFERRLLSMADKWERTDRSTNELIDLITPNKWKQDTINNSVPYISLGTGDLSARNQDKANVHLLSYVSENLQDLKKFRNKNRQTEIFEKLFAVLDRLNFIADDVLNRELYLEEYFLPSISGDDAPSYKLRAFSEKDYLQRLSDKYETIEGIDFTGFDASGATIGNIIFKNCLFGDNSNFSNLQTTFSRFEDCEFNGACFDRAKFRSTNIVQCTSINSSFKKSRWYAGSELRLFRMTNTDFSEVDFGAKFAGEVGGVSRMSGIIAEDSDFRSTLFPDDALGVKLSHCETRGAQFIDSGRERDDLEYRNLINRFAKGGRSDIAGMADEGAAARFAYDSPEKVSKAAVSLLTGNLMEIIGIDLKDNSITKEFADELLDELNEGIRDKINNKLIPKYESARRRFAERYAVKPKYWDIHDFTESEVNIASKLREKYGQRYGYESIVYCNESDIGNDYFVESRIYNNNLWDELVLKFPNGVYYHYHPGIPTHDIFILEDSEMQQLSFTEKLLQKNTDYRLCRSDIFCPKTKTGKLYDLDEIKSLAFDIQRGSSELKM